LLHGLVSNRAAAFGLPLNGAANSRNQTSRRDRHKKHEKSQEKLFVPLCVFLGHPNCAQENKKSRTSSTKRLSTPNPMSATSAPLIPSTQRPIPLQARADLVTKRIEYQGVGYWVIKEPVGLKYYRLQPEQYHALWMLDGERSLENIRDELQAKLPTVRLQLADIQHLITDLHEKGLVFSKRPGQGISLLRQHRKEKRKKRSNTLKSLLYLRLPGWDPEESLQTLYPFVRWLFRPWAVACAIAFVASAWILLAVQFDRFQQQLPEFQQFFGWPNLMYLWFVLGAAKIIHEFGHGLSCKHYGGECHEMGIMLLVFSPCLYCDVSDSWILRNKWHRIIIGAAGMYIEIFLSGIAIYVWWNTQPGLLHHLALNVFFVTTVTTVIFNANPLMRFDGYYMMADFLEIPNLRPKSDKLLRETFAWWCLGIESRPDPFMPETGRVWFALFAIAAGIYRWFIVAAITIFLYTVLKPYGLQSIGITLAVVSVSTILYGMISNIYKIISAPRIEPMSRPKIAISLLVLTIVIVCGLAIPLPLHVEAMYIIEPHQVQHVYTTVPGQLLDPETDGRAVTVVAGQRVKSGQVLAVLTNEEIEDPKTKMESDRDAQRSKIDAFVAGDLRAHAQLAQDRLAAIEAQIVEYENQIDALTIRAPCSGIVIEPPSTPRPTIEQLETQLGSWHGTPLSQRNDICFLPERTHFCSIAPDKRYQATLLVDQTDRNDVFVGQAVELKFDHLPDRTYHGIVEQISGRHLDFVPELLSNKLGGELPTVTDKQGRERLTGAAYQTTVLVEEDTELLRTGMRGRARFLIEKRTAGEWIWRYLRETFHFRL